METLKIDIDEAIDAPIKVAKSNSDNIDGEDTFSKYVPIYMAPTGNVKDTVNLYKNNMSNIDSALVMGFQGALASKKLSNNTQSLIQCLVNGYFLIF